MIDLEDNQTEDAPPDTHSDESVKWANVLARRKYVEAQGGTGTPEGSGVSDERWGRGVDRLLRHDAEQTMTNPKAPPEAMQQAARYLAHSHNAEAVAGTKAARERALSASAAGNSADMARRLMELHTQYQGDPDKTTAQFFAEGWDRTLITPQLLSGIDEQIKAGHQQTIQAPDRATADAAGQQIGALVHLRQQLHSLRDEPFGPPVPQGPIPPGAFDLSEPVKAGPKPLANPVDVLDPLAGPAPEVPHNLRDRLAQKHEMDAAATDAGFGGRLKASAQAAFASGFGNAGGVWDRILDAAHDDRKPKVNAPGPSMQQLGMEMVGATPKTMAIAERAGLIEHAIGGLAGLPTMAMDPIATGAMLATGGVGGAVLKSEPVALLLSGIESKAGPRAAAALGHIISGSTGIGAFSGVDAMARYPNWDTDPAGGVHAVGNAVADGMEVGAVFGMGHAAIGSLAGQLIGSKASPADAAKMVHEKSLSEGADPAEARSTGAAVGMVYDAAKQAAEVPEVAEMLGHASDHEAARVQLANIAQAALAEKMVKPESAPEAAAPPAEVKPAVEPQADQGNQQIVGEAGAAGHEASVPEAVDGSKSASAPIAPESGSTGVSASETPSTGVETAQVGVTQSPVIQKVADEFSTWFKKSDPEAFARMQAVKLAEERTAAEAARNEALVGMKGRKLTRAGVESYLIKKFEAQGVEQNAATAADSEGNVAGIGAHSRTFYQKLPSEITDQMRPDQAARIFSVTQDRSKAGGEDAASDIGWDKYIQEALRDSTKRIERAKAHFRDSPNDPEAAFYAALHDAFPRKELGIKTATADPAALKAGDTFEIGGIKVRVEDEGGESSFLVLKDGDHLPETPLSALDKVPIDKGTLKREGEGEPAVSPDATISKDGPEPEPSEPNPNTIGLNKAEQNRIRAELSLSELDPAKRRGWEEVMNEAKAEEIDRDAVRLAREVADSSRLISDKEHAGMVLKAAELANEYDAAVADAARLVDAGEHGQAAEARKHADAILADIDTLTEGTRHGRREVARALSIGRMMVDRESFQLAQVMQRAKSAKGTALNPEQTAKIEMLTQHHEELQKQLMASEKRYESMKAERDRIAANRVVEVQARSEEARKRFVGAKTKLATERADIRKKLVGLGYRANDITGIGGEAAFLLGQYALSYAKEGALTLAEVVRKVREDFPDFTEDDIHRAIATKDPKSQGKARTEATKRVAQIKRQAELLVKVEEAQKGVFDAPKEKPAPPEEIATLRKQLSALRNEAYRSTIEASRLEKAIQTINELQDHLDNHTRALKKKPTEAGPELVAAREKAATLRKLLNTKDELASLNEQLQTGEFVVKEKPAPKEVPEELDRLRIEVKKAKSNIRQAIDEMRPMTVGRAVGEGLNTLRTLKATADMSATLRQALVLSARRPITATKAFGQSFKAFFSEHTAEQIDHAIKSDPNQYLRDKAGLYLSPLDSFSASPREEAFMSRLAEKIPLWGQVVKASERHMISHLNLMRSAAFDGFVEKVPNATTAELKAWADFVNKASGRGDLKTFGQAGKTLATIFFAPRFAVSRFQTPWALVKHWEHPRVRTEIAKDLVSTVGLGMSALTIAGLAGADVTTDPSDSDFGKIRVGDTRIDVFGGFLQPARLVASIGLVVTDRTGLTSPSTHIAKSGKNKGQPIPDVQPIDPMEAVERFAEFKLSPAVSFPYELLTGKNVVGQPVSPTKAAAEAFLPIMYSDIADAYKDQDPEGPGHPFRAAGVGAASFLGIGTGTHPDNAAATRRKNAWEKRFQPD